jgi:hypothetical protein
MSLDLGKQDLRELAPGLGRRSVSALSDVEAGKATGTDAISPGEAKAYVIEHSFERASAVSEKRLKSEARKCGVGSALPEDVADISQHPECSPKCGRGR